MIVVTILFGAAAFLYVYCYLKVTKKRGYLESLGIPVVKPGFFFGSPPILKQHVLMHKVFQENFKKFNSKTYGIYDGSRPMIITIDPKVIKAVAVEKFECFMDGFDIQVSIILPLTKIQK